ncbi:hypothetical protein [Motiliproteus sp.]|uniref:hypothetical protein n=1 Tax=Motiliproteus sp. TaxID=1898955 RepID=UPI003BAB2B69
MPNIIEPNKITVSQLLIYAAFISLVLSILGMLSQHFLLSHFQISLSDYADIDDFIVASIGALFSVLGFEWYHLLVIAIVLAFFYELCKSRLWIVRLKNYIPYYDTSAVDTATKIGLPVTMFAFLSLISIVSSGKSYNQIINGQYCEVDIKLKHDMGGFIRRFGDDGILYNITGLNSAYFVYETTPALIEENKNSFVVHVIKSDSVAQLIYDCREQGQQGG